jgi:bifunctional NMN adenylyltransferase/nudix hydrolase
MKTKTETAEVGVVVGRFQVPALHEIHKELINKVVATHPRVMLFLGLAPDACRCTYNNPLDFVTRRAMIQTEYPDIEIHYIKDQHSDESWSADLDNQIKTHIGVGQKVVLYGGRDSFIPHYTGKFPAVELTASKIVSGKEIRKNIGIKSKNTAEFREGVTWAVENQWPSTLPTVDIAIIDRDKKQVLLAIRSGEEEYRFPGGFADPNSDSYEDDALREAAEETHLEVGMPLYLGSFKSSDWRFKNERNKIKTILYACDYIFGSPTPDDDLNTPAKNGVLEWIPFNKLDRINIVITHKVLLARLLGYLTEQKFIEYKGLL